MKDCFLGVIDISKEKVIERRLSKRISQQLQLAIRSHATGHEIQKATIENISIGGMQFSVPADNDKLQIHDTCSFIFDIPALGKCYILGEIRYCRNFIDANQQPVIHYGVKFIKLSMKTWHYIKHCCQDEADFSGNTMAKELDEVPENVSTVDTLTTQTLELIQVKIRPDKGPEFNGIVRDINYGGMKLQFSQAIPQNTNLSIWVSFMDYTVSATGKCNVCQQISSNPPAFLANIGFTDINQLQFDNLQSLMMKLAAYMADLIHKSL